MVSHHPTEILVLPLITSTCCFIMLDNLGYGDGPSMKLKNYRDEHMTESNPEVYDGYDIWGIRTTYEKIKNV